MRKVDISQSEHRSEAARCRETIKLLVPHLAPSPVVVWRREVEKKRALGVVTRLGTITLLHSSVCLH